MIYRFPITTPKNTDKEGCQVTELPLTYGVIHAVSISFPPGPAGVYHITLWREGHQIWPSDPGEDFAWEDGNLVFSEQLSIEAEPYMMWAKTWNDSTKYEHLVVVRFAILPRELLYTAREELTILQRLETLIFGAPERGA